MYSYADSRRNKTNAMALMLIYGPFSYIWFNEIPVWIINYTYY